MLNGEDMNHVAKLHYRLSWSIVISKNAKNAKADADFLPNSTPTTKKNLYLTDEHEFNNNNSKIFRKQTLAQSRKKSGAFKRGPQ